MNYQRYNGFKETLEYLYLEKQMSIRMIADQFGVSHGYIWNTMRDMDIPFRSRHCRIHTKRKDRYYYKRRNCWVIWADGKQKFEHRVIAENMLGRKLKKTEIVHHINGIGTDNRPENICITTQRRHAKIHYKNSGLARFNAIEHANRMTNDQRRAMWRAQAARKRARKKEQNSPTR